MKRYLPHYQAEIEEEKRPSDLRKKVLTSSKAPVEVDLQSSSRPPMMTRAVLTLGKDSGQTSKKSK